MKHQSKKYTVIRVTALVLAALLLLNIIPYVQTAGTLVPASFDNNASEIAAEELINSSDYLQGNRAQRMQGMVGHYLTGGDTLEYSEFNASLAISKGEYAEAINYTGESIERCDGSRETLGALYLRKGYLYTLLGKNEQAITWLNKGIVYKPDPEAYLTRAQVKANMGDLDGAIADVNVYLDTADDAIRMLPNLVNVYESHGDYAMAVQLYTRLINDDRYRKTAYYLDRAYCYTLLGDLENAESDCETYRKLNGEYDSTVDLMLGIGFMRGEKYDKALERFVAAAEAEPELAAQVEYYIVLCAYVSGDYNTACEYGDRVVERINNGGDNTVAQLSLDRKGQVDITLAETDVASLCKMTGAAHVQRGDFEQAVESLNACLASTGDRVYAHYLRGTCYLAAGKYEQAAEDFTRAIDVGEEVEKSKYGRGICYIQLSDYDAAVEDLDWVMMNGEDSDLFEQSAELVSLAMEKKAAEEQQLTDATATPDPALETEVENNEGKEADQSNQSLN